MSNDVLRVLDDLRKVIMIPKRALDPAGVVSQSLAIKSRGRSADRSLSEDITTRPVGSELRSRNFTDLTGRMTDGGNERISSKGAFLEFPALGVTAGFLSDQAAKEAEDSLSADYEMVQNFPLDLPLRVTMGGVSANRGRAALAQREWPDASGVHDAHAQGIRGSDVLVGVLDTGIDSDHAEFEAKTITYRYVSPVGGVRDIRGFDTNGHGTHVSGIIAGRNVGVAPEASLYVASVIESESLRSSLLRVASGLNWLLQQFSRPENQTKPAVLNLSLGFPPSAANNLPAGEFNQRLNVLRTLLKTLVQANVVPVVAIGNEGPNTFRYPGAFKEVLGVGAVDFSHKVAGFSGNASVEGSKPDVAGYGVSVYSSIERDYAGSSVYERLNGTSMATPYVTGITALHRCRDPQMDVAATIKTVRDTALQLRGQPASRVGMGLARFA